VRVRPSMTRSTRPDPVRFRSFQAEPAAGRDVGPFPSAVSCAKTGGAAKDARHITIRKKRMRPAWNKILPLVQFLLIPLLAACSVNPATGEKQFTALMPPSQEAAIGAQEHQKVESQFGEFIEGPVA